MSIRFGSALRVLRTARGLSLRGLARRLNVSPAYLSQVENGKLPAPSHERIIELSETLDVPPHRLFALASKIPPTVTRLLERTPEAARFLSKASAMEFPSKGFHRLVEAFDALGVDGVLSALESAMPKGDKPLNGASGPLHQVSAPPDYSLAQHLRADLVMVDLELEAWADVVDTVAEAMVEHLGDHVDPDDIATPLTEEDYPDCVCIGGGVAVPHLTLDSIDTSLLAVARLETPIRTEAEPQLRYVFLLLGSPEPEIRHLRHLARIVQLCTNHSMQQALEAAETAGALQAALISADQSIQ